MWLIFKASFFESRETPLARYFLAKLRKVYGRDHHKNSSIVVWDRYGRCPSFSVQEKREGKKWGTKMRGGEKRIQRNYRHHEEETAHQPTGRGSRKETLSYFLLSIPAFMFGTHFLFERALAPTLHFRVSVRATHRYNGGQ